MRGLAALVLLLVVAAPAAARRAVVDWEFDYVNVRSAPTLEAGAVGRLTAGAEAEVLARRDGWVEIRYPGGEGWVVDRSLRPLPEPLSVADAPGAPAEAPTPEESPPAATPRPAVPAPADPRPESRAPDPAEPPPAPEADAPGGYLSEYPESDLPAVDPAGSLVSLLGGLLLVLGLLAGAVYLVRRFMGRPFAGGRSRNAIQVLASRPLGPRHGIVLVEAGGLVWLLAQGPDGVRLLSEIRDDDALRRLNDRFGFLETPFEAELRGRLDLESEEGASQAPPTESPPREPSPDERLAALRRRPGPGEGP